MSLIQRITNQLIAWGETLGLTFNPAKTVCMLFTRDTEKTIKYPRNKLRINNTDINFSSDTRYLGVQIDNKLNWNQHFDKVTTRAKQYIAGLARSLNKTWGPKPKIARWLYTAIVRPRLSYASVAWAHSITQIHRKQKLERINRLASTILTPLRVKTPSAALEIINDLTPLDLFLQEVGLNTFCRLKLMNNTGWLKKNSKPLRFTPHLKYWQKEASNALGHMQDEETTLEYIDNKDYSISIDSSKGRAKPTLSEINVYTDGSKTKQGAGAGYVIIAGKSKVQYTQSLNLPSTATIFQAELIAITQAAEYLSSAEYKPRYIKIFCDSQAALKALSGSICKANTVKEAHDSLNKLAERNKTVRLQWIKAHIGLDGNELADEYAKLGTTDTSEHVKTYNTANQIKTGIRHYIYHKWREKWSALKKCRQTKIFYPMPDRSKFRQVKHFSRNELKLYIQAITGQNNLNYLNSIIVKDYTSLCRFCEEEDETFVHIVVEDSVAFVQLNWKELFGCPLRVPPSSVFECLLV